MKLSLFDLKPGLAGSASIVGGIADTADVEPSPADAEEPERGDDAGPAQPDCKSR